MVPVSRWWKFLGSTDQTPTLSSRGSRIVGHLSGLPNRDRQIGWLLGLRADKAYDQIILRYSRVRPEEKQKGTPRIEELELLFPMRGERVISGQ